MVLSWAIVKMRIHRHSSWYCKMQDTLLSSEGGPCPPKSTVTAILGEHHTAVTATLTPALSLLSFRDNHPGQFFPSLTHTSTCSLFCTPFLLLSLRPEVLLRGQGRSMEDTTSLFIKCNSRLIPPGVTGMSWSVWHGCDSTVLSPPMAVASPAAVIWCPTSLWAPQQALQSQQQARNKTNKPYFWLEASMV